MQPQSTGNVSEDRAASRARRAARPPSEGRRVTPQPRLLEFRLPAVPQAWVPLPVAVAAGAVLLWLRGWAEEARKRTAWPRSSLRRALASNGRSPGKARPGLPRTACSLPAPALRRLLARFHTAPPLPSLPPLGSVRSSRYGCAAEAPVAAASAIADARPSAALPLAVGTACGDGSGDVGPALLLPGGGRGGRSGGGGVAAAALGRAEHRGGSRRGARRPCVLPAVRGPQSRPLGASGPRTRGAAPRQGAAAHPGGCCQGDGKRLGACAQRAGDARGLGCQVSHLPWEGSGGRGDHWPTLGSGGCGSTANSVKASEDPPVNSIDQRQASLGSRMLSGGKDEDDAVTLASGPFRLLQNASSCIRATRIQTRTPHDTQMSQVKDLTGMNTKK